MSITRVGATKEYSDGWEKIFGGGKGRATAKKKSARPAAKSKSRSPAKARSRKPAKKKAQRK
jgi:hypothetical protein